MLQADYTKRILKFNFIGGTSRGVLTEKPSWIIRLWDSESPNKQGVGEVSIIPNLSVENESIVENEFQIFKKNPTKYLENPIIYPAIKFGIETAILDLKRGGRKILYPSKFTEGKDGILINGLVWMGNKSQMLSRIKEKIEKGFNCIKIKVGAINFDDEISLLEFIRKQFSKNVLELRVDANGAFLPEMALEKLNILSKYDIHSIEQPIMQGQWKCMQELCKKTPVPIALDEELIGIKSTSEKVELLKAIKPQYIILKPSLVGGLSEAKEWSKLAEKQNIGWWVTSALEANIGLNAIAQWAYKYGKKIPQGLGTGSVFSNNIKSPLLMKEQKLWYNPDEKWNNN